ncbi:hypothetical protein [Streptomonospora nanhaiensis]|uniref:hypothetical protein n=1 Tax=Streptomonospora nanhaiensis TaxID=1323731 RepID=UPI001C39309C|nr:hypothetical protein [Streptomonospora nanhaiensis]MBV2365464.1 hypothetical protein [Streptomonospora nanhaiensis]
MNESAVNNTTGENANVGIQAGAVHNSTVYQVLPDSPPSRKYQVGVRFLENGAPTRARGLIEEAIAHGHDGGEVRFHWVLAMLSKRSYRDLAPEERAALGRVSGRVHTYAADDWRRALKAICDLLDCLSDSGGDPGLALKELQNLPALQRDKIIRHLDLVLTGGMKDSLWVQTRQAAEENRLGRDRLKRVWAYFEPDPAGARARHPEGSRATPGDRLCAVAWSVLFTLAAGYMGWSVLTHAGLVPDLAYLVALAAGVIAARSGIEWHYRVGRLRDKDLEYIETRRNSRAPEGGFANRVDHAFEYYFTKYAPDRRAAWLAETAGIRGTLRDEVAEIYREERVSADKVRWLIRYLVRDVRRRWLAGRLLEHRAYYKVTATTKARFLASSAALAAAAVSVAVATVQEAPLPGAAAVAAAVVGARFAAPLWLLVFGERRRVVEDEAEYSLTLAEREEEHARWKAKLETTRPSEMEMEEWLNCDKTLILDRALRHYRLAWRDILAYALLQTPAKGCKRAQLQSGPWRYSKYEIRIYLVTHDGVREVTTELDFEKAETMGQERDNFRFESVSSVHVSESDDHSYTLNLTLMNGPAKEILVTGPNAQEPDAGESPGEQSQVNLDAAGFGHTLRILEGIAAEGKMWIGRAQPPSASDDPFAKAEVGSG